MTTFDTYAAYYDLLYRNKDYAGEAAYIHGLIQENVAEAKSIFELGCGTGGHALELASLGYEVTGIDLSPTMIVRANTRVERSVGQGYSSYRPRPRFLQGDLRDYRLDRKFDVVVALFHVMSYQVSNADLCAAVATAKAHLSRNGVFIFDCWYGPGVLHDPPAVRVLRLQGDDLVVTRIAEPDHFPNENRVDVRYEVLVERDSGVERFREKHAMRYLFMPEIDLILEANGMSRRASYGWMTNTDPDNCSWTACCVCE